MDWNKDTKMASPTYDASKTNQDEILNRIALAGYDSDQFLTSDDVYQRGQFNTLSENMYQLLKVSKQDSTTYYQHCPMANGGKGANWLSKENAIKNPYYGSAMLTCGKTVETIE